MYIEEHRANPVPYIFLVHIWLIVCNFNSMGKTWNSLPHRPYLVGWWHWKNLSGSPAELLRFVFVYAMACDLKLWPTHSHCKGRKQTFLQSPSLALFYFVAMQSYLFVKCYSHDMVVCAVYVCDCILEHHWGETREETGQYLMEPSKPLVSFKGLEMGTYDDEDPPHHMTSHTIWDIKDLSNNDMRGFKRNSTPCRTHISL